MDKANDYDVSEAEVIGRGAYGTVYLCKRKSDGRQIIFKEIPMGQMSAEDRQGAMNEVQVHKMLPPHANIVQHLDYFIHDSSHALIIVMEYIRGGTLYDFILKRGTSLLEESEVLHLFVQMALALHHIHSRGILHRDIKTQNILLTKPSSFITNNNINQDRDPQMQSLVTATTVKLSDFGISKILASKSKAYSVVGTPCYISPELCESKPYNQKSDIWALGCVLYELCTLSRAFEAANLPALVFKIMKGSYKQISDTYSPELKQLVRSLLNLDHTKRPSVSQILAQPIIVKVMYCTIVGIGAITMNTASSRNQKVGNEYSSAKTRKDNTHNEGTSQCIDADGNTDSRNNNTNVNDRGGGNSAMDNVSSVYMWGCSKHQYPANLALPSGVCRMQDIAIGRSHKYALSDTGKIFSWEQVETNEEESCTMQLPGMTTAESSSGFLSSTSTCFVPRCLEGQGGVVVAKIACGDLFAACVTDRGILMTFGSGSSGCLGHGNFHDVKQPKIVEALIGSEVMDLACGSNHAVALTTDQELFSWGIGDNGRLGLASAKWGSGASEGTAAGKGGSGFRGCNVPVALNAQVFESNVVKVHCGLDTTCFITRNNKIYVCGSNRDNKLCLDYFSHEDNHTKQVDFINQPTRIKHELFTHIVACSVGYTHGAFIDSEGQLVLSGSNSTGQLGLPSTDRSVGTRHVTKLDWTGGRNLRSECRFVSVSCGDYFTVAVCVDGTVLSWGRNAKGRLGRPITQGGNDTPGQVQLKGVGEGRNVKVQCSHDGTMLLVQQSHGHSN